MFEEAPSLDLSKATKLEEVEFRMRAPRAGWINATLNTTKTKNLRRITIHCDGCYFGDHRNVQQWRNLDHFLVQLWTTRRIPLLFTYRAGWDSSIWLITELLPESNTRGALRMQPVYINEIISGKNHILIY